MSQPVEQANNENTNDEAEFEPLKGFENDYEIQTTYPYNIRKKKTGRILKKSSRGYGYIQVHLNLISYSKHILIAKQFLPNPDNLPEVDHINHDRSDYHLSNLRWCTHIENTRNKAFHNHIPIEYIDSISDDATVIDEYNNHEFTDYYFDDDNFYYYIGMKYKKLRINESKYGSKYVIMISNEHKFVRIYISIFKRSYGLM
ncbi:hypothetical protein M9Y10_044537 [Tritrichomonas musculus]|uniref:HNH nuclease domain-containing protein n=1 Tax=Tritrichomonas musculus TaxID=1915356 RepID=A0ABR2JVK9_9EUKA